MGIVALLNLANYAHWIAFPAVAKKAAAYYQVTGDQLDMIPTVSYAAGIPTCLLATYIVESRGLRTGIRIGSFLTGFGGLLCCVSTFPGLAVYIPFKAGIHIYYILYILNVLVFSTEIYVFKAFFRLKMQFSPFSFTSI